MATTFEIDSVTRVSVKLEKFIPNARERVKRREEKRKRKEKRRKKNEIQTKFLTPSKSICPRYHRPQTVIVKTMIVKENGGKKKKNLDGLVTATLRRKR